MVYSIVDAVAPLTQVAASEISCYDIIALKHKGFKKTYKLQLFTADFMGSKVSGYQFVGIEDSNFTYGPVHATVAAAVAWARNDPKNKVVVADTVSDLACFAVSGCC